MSKYIPIAQAIAQLSKDTTKVGAVIIGASGEGGPWGYNGAPRGCSADEDDRKERPEKYFWFEHAERNAIYAAARAGFSTNGTTLVVTHPPCIDCARAIVQAGIVRVIAGIQDDEFNQRWVDSAIRTKRLFEECGIEYKRIKLAK
jgi:dCMP deaminase